MVISEIRIPLVYGHIRNHIRNSLAWREGVEVGRHVFCVIDVRADADGRRLRLKRDQTALLGTRGGIKTTVKNLWWFFGGKGAFTGGEICHAPGLRAAFTRIAQS